MGRKVRLTRLSIFSNEKTQITVWIDHIVSAEAHEDGGTWLRINSDMIRVEQTEAEIESLISEAC